MAVAISGYPYTPRAAVMDVADNSVANEATSLLIQLPDNSEKGRVVVADNGTGIAPDTLNEVLRAGSRTQALYTAQSLSRYGIGLKGAGFSLGGKIVVLTRWKGEITRRRAIELSVIEHSDAWFQDTRDPDEDEVKYFNSLLAQLPGAGQRETGTVVIIEELNIRSREIGRLKADIARALGETYSKFIASGRLSVQLNDRVIEAVDPLHRENPSTVVLYKQEPVKLNNGTTIYFSAVSLPHPNQVDIETRRAYRYTQSNQGFYLYRNGRLIRSGETLGLFSYDFHYNAFRAELEYNSEADDDIKVDVAKSTVTATPEIQQKLQEMVTIARKTAETLWRERDVLTEEDIVGLFDESNRLIGARTNLLVETAVTRKANKKPSNGKVVVETPPAKPKAKPQDIPYLIPKESLPGDVLYRPIYDGELQSVVVEINLSHPFSKAVFSVSPGEGRGSLPRKATTATQQLLFVLGAAEYGLAGDDGNEKLLEQFRRYASMNLRALLD
jgi:hypothetical protein